MATVYQIQNPLRYRRDKETGEITGSEPAYDVTGAWEYGEVEIMLPIGNRMLSPNALVARLKHKLSKFNDDDSILGIGDPVSIGIAVALAGRVNNGRIHVLRWDREQQIYTRQLYNLAGDNHGSKERSDQL